jgi:hypothetical protein
MISKNPLLIILLLIATQLNVFALVDSTKTEIPLRDLPLIDVHAHTLDYRYAFGELHTKIKPV